MSTAKQRCLKTYLYLKHLIPQNRVFLPSALGGFFGGLGTPEEATHVEVLTDFLRVNRSVGDACNLLGHRARCLGGGGRFDLGKESFNEGGSHEGILP